MGTSANLTTVDSIFIYIYMLYVYIGWCPFQIHSSRSLSLKTFRPWALGCPTQQDGKAKDGRCVVATSKTELMPSQFQSQLVDDSWGVVLPIILGIIIVQKFHKVGNPIFRYHYFWIRPISFRHCAYENPWISNMIYIYNYIIPCNSHSQASSVRFGFRLWVHGNTLQVRQSGAMLPFSKLQKLDKAAARCEHGIHCKSEFHRSASRIFGIKW
jgi:hypothetical protein